MNTKNTYRTILKSTHSGIHRKITDEILVNELGFKRVNKESIYTFVYELEEDGLKFTFLTLSEELDLFTEYAFWYKGVYSDWLHQVSVKDVLDIKKEYKKYLQTNPKRRYNDKYVSYSAQFDE